jgi:hypothetical protein
MEQCEMKVASMGCRERIERRAGGVLWPWTTTSLFFAWLGQGRTRLVSALSLTRELRVTIVSVRTARWLFEYLNARKRIFNNR